MPGRDVMVGAAGGVDAGDVVGAGVPAVGLGGVVAGGAGARTAPAGRVEHQVDQRVTAAGLQGALITRKPSTAGVLVEHGVHPDGVCRWEVGAQGGHPVGLGPHPHPPLSPGPLSPSLGRGGVSRQHRPPRRSPHLPRGLLRSLDQHQLLNRRGVLPGQVQRLGIEDAGLDQGDPTRLQRRQGGRQPGTQRPGVTHPTRRGPRRRAQHQPHLGHRRIMRLQITGPQRLVPNLRTVHERGHLPELPSLRPRDHPLPPPTRSRASNSRCSGPDSVGCANRSANIPSGRYSDQRTGSATPGESSTRQ